MYVYVCVVERQQLANQTNLTTLLPPNTSTSALFCLLARRTPTGISSPS